jgi:hypothetical protein
MKKAVPEGMSRGGLIIFNCGLNTEKQCIYADVSATISRIIKVASFKATK